MSTPRVLNTRVRAYPTHRHSTDPSIHVLCGRALSTMLQGTFLANAKTPSQPGGMWKRLKQLSMSSESIHISSSGPNSTREKCPKCGRSPLPPRRRRRKAFEGTRM
eukprot:1653366-Pyramimonas_sp.AAC.1